MNYQSLMNKDTPIFRYFELTKTYYSRYDTQPLAVFLNNDRFIEEENQLRFISFLDKLTKCDGCASDWIIDDTLRVFYLYFQRYAQSVCSHNPSRTAGTIDTSAPVP